MAEQDFVFAECGDATLSASLLRRSFPLAFSEIWELSSQRDAQSAEHSADLSLLSLLLVNVSQLLVKHLLFALVYC